MQTADFVFAPLPRNLFGSHVFITAHNRTMPDWYQSVYTAHLSSELCVLQALV